MIRKNSVRLSAIQLAELMGKEVTYIEKVKKLIIQYPEEENKKLAKRLVGK